MPSSAYSRARGIKLAMDWVLCNGVNMFCFSGWGNVAKFRVVRERLFDCIRAVKRKDKKGNMDLISAGQILGIFGAERCNEI